MKQWISFLLAMVLLFSCVPMGAIAAEPTSPDNDLQQPTAELQNVAEGVSVKWNAVEDAESYLVYRKASGAASKLLKEVTATEYVDKTAKGGVSYTYRVVAKKGDVVSSNSQSARILRLGKANVTVKNAKAGVLVEWSRVDGAQCYRVYRRIPDGSWKTLKSNVTELNFTDTTAAAGTVYQYAVRPYDATGFGPFASGSQIPRLEQPKVTVSNKTNGIRLNWDAAAGADSYNVYRKVSGGSWQILRTRTNNEYFDSNVQNGVTYYYMVRSKNGEILSSNMSAVKILRLINPVATVSNGNDGPLIKWSAVEGAQSYQIFRKIPGGSWKKVATDITELKFTDTTAKSGKTYSYAVRAYGNGVLSSYTATAEIQYLSRPTVSVEMASATSATIRWNSVNGAEAYIVYIKTSGTDWEKIYTGTKTTYTANGLTLGQKYSFAVRAVDGDFRSTRSAGVSVKATFPAPAYSLKLKSGKGIEISWTAVEGAGSYRVYRRESGGSWKTLKTTTSTSYVDTNGQVGVTYEYAVRAFELKKAGGVSGVRAMGQTILYSTIDPNKPMVALTFDDGPSAYTKDILDQLEKYGAHATFFVVGQRVSSYASTIRRAYSLGCEIGNHSWSHPNLASISIKTMQSEISRTDAAIESVIGKKPTLLRPPYGSVDSDVRNYAGKPLIHWSIDTLDWSTRNSSKTISSVLNNVRDGSIVLMHDIYAATRDAAVSLIPTLISRGYQLVTVSEMAAYHGTTLRNGSIYYSLP